MKDESIVIVLESSANTSKNNTAESSWALFFANVIWVASNASIVPAESDDNVDLIDLILAENDNVSFLYGYYSTDLNGDGNVDLLDFPELENNINNFVYSYHP